MLLKNETFKGRYVDSVVLMAIAREVKKLPGVAEAAVLMGTEANKAILSEGGLLTEEGQGASPDDLLIGLKVSGEEAYGAALRKIEELLASGTGRPEEGSGEYIPRTLDGALDSLPEANLVLISLPGEYCRFEAESALRRGRHVFLFSDNVPLEDEIALKTMAAERGLLVMGPDCGTAILNGVALGFANVVRRGPVGIVGASGTGIQEVSVRVHNLGSGISQAIGTGGRDLSSEVGGLSMLSGLRALAEDPDTEVIILISKPPAPEVEKRVLEAAARLDTPCVINFLFGSPEESENRGLPFASTLEEAAGIAVAMLKGTPYEKGAFDWDLPSIVLMAEEEISRLSASQRFLRGLFSGGTLCEEAAHVLGPFVTDLYSNMPLKSAAPLDDPNASRGHCFVDLGDDLFTRGRPHPMIDYELRCKRIMEEARDPETALILMDVVLGYGSHPNPAEELCPVITEAKVLATSAGRYLPFVASVCGTKKDPQDLSKQVRMLREAGVTVLPSNAQAARFAAIILAKEEAIDRWQPT